MHKVDLIISLLVQLKNGKWWKLQKWFIPSKPYQSSYSHAPHLLDHYVSCRGFTILKNLSSQPWIKTMPFFGHLAISGCFVCPWVQESLSTCMSNKSLKRHMVSSTWCPIYSNYYLRLSRLMGQWPSRGRWPMIPCSRGADLRTEEYGLRHKEAGLRLRRRARRHRMIGGLI